MKKNILTIIIMAIVLINTALTALLIFTIVPSAQKTSKLIDKVASIVDLELESPEAEVEIPINKTTTFTVPDELTINLISDDGKDHFAIVPASVTMYTEHKDYKALNPKVEENVTAIKGIITDEFQKYTKEEVLNEKAKIEQRVLIELQKYFKSDFIIDVTFGNIILQ